jgi:fluoride exporter
VISSIFVVIGGFLGAICRFLLSGWISRRYSSFPVGTITVNLLGSFLLGWITGHELNETWKLLFGTGFMGAFTTFSTLKWESVQMVAKQEKKKFFLYLGLSYLLGILSAFTGYCSGVWMKG